MEDTLGQGEDSDDEWFYESIRRYDDLLMFDVQGNICCTAFYDETKVLLGVSRESLHELWLLNVPDKLVAGRSAGLVKNRDFNLVAAGYTNGSVKKVVRVRSSVVVAEEGGIHLYTIPESNNATDVIKLTNTLTHSIDGEVALAVSQDERVYAGDLLSNFIQLDLSSEKSQKPIVLPSTSQRRSDKISEVQCAGDKLFICLENKGSVLIIDQRTGSIVQEIEQEDTRGLWTMDTSEDLDFVALASSCGSAYVRDLRDTRKVYSCTLENAQNWSQKVTVHLSPSGPFLSLSGFDRTVEIHNYKCSESDSKVFCHDGHRGEDVHGILTHMWHPTQKKLLFSADNTGKLNAWRFKLPLNM